MALEIARRYEGVTARPGAGAAAGAGRVRVRAEHRAVSQPGFRRAPLGIPIEISQEFSTCAKGNKPMYLSERKPYIDPGCELYFDV